MRFKNALKKFLYETFRPRTGADYAAVLSKQADGKAFPWLYSRVLLLSLLLFAAISFAYRFSGINFIAVAFTGGVFADLVFLVLLYELYPSRDFSFPVLLAVFAAGGILSSACAYFLYGVYDIRQPFAMQAWTAFVEETSKGITVVIVIALYKKRNPLGCFILGAAVGGGFSAFENMWYMYTGGIGYGFLSDGVLTALVRALGTPFSHAAWAGTFGWALSSLKPHKNPLPYAVFAFNYVMHFFVNFPLMEMFAGWKGYPISAVTGIMSFTMACTAVVKSRRELTGTCGGAGHIPAVNRDFVLREETRMAAFAAGRGLRANVAAAFAVLFLSAALLGPACVFGGYSEYKVYEYDTFEECRAAAQNGLDLAPDFGRQYRVTPNPGDNFAYAYQEGEAVYVIQREQAGEYFYRYRYGFNQYPVAGESEGKLYINYYGADIPVYDTLSGEKLNGFTPVKDKDSQAITSVKKWELQTVGLEYEGGVYTNRTFYEQNGDGELIARKFFVLNPSFISAYARDGGGYSAVFAEETPVRLTESIVFTSVFAAAFAGAGIVYAAEKIKSRRNKNVG